MLAISEGQAITGNPGPYFVDSVARPQSRKMGIESTGEHVPCRIWFMSARAALQTTFETGGIGTVRIDKGTEQESGQQPGPKFTDIP